jgi:hypothetical protein
VVPTKRARFMSLEYTKSRMGGKLKRVYPSFWQCYD